MLAKILPASGDAGFVNSVAVLCIPDSSICLQAGYHYGKGKAACTAAI